jgi:hypothetical protein
MFCKYANCITRAIFNYLGKKTGIFCSVHKLDKMVDVISKTCIFEEGCNRQPSFNNLGETQKLYCSVHKLDGMVNVKHKTCREEGCNTRPSFNNLGEKKGIFCSVHKKNGMVDVINKTCREEGCNTQPIFNYLGEKERLYCSLHKKDGMVDVINKTCREEGCNTLPSFNNLGEKERLYCSVHKKDGMVNVIDKTCIFEEGCNTLPIFNYLGEKERLYCSLHKKDGMINVKDKTCLTQSCPIRVMNKYNGYCFRCFIYLHPNEKIARNYKTKEIAVVEYVKTKYPEFSWISDRMISDGCSRRRPDLFLDLGYQIIIIEVDENQHVDYDTSCENRRIMEISRDVGHREIIFIRFNPDDYKSGEINVTSCWGTNKKSLCVVKKNKKNEWNSRLEELSRNIEYWINNKTDKMIETINLFYDE